ncbi:hypothetical protein ACQPZZ_33740 [Microbispora sp. CA-135349]|uniref:RNA polymerase sigma factor n=1 Tax=Microbispora sp. CA-135349 TaxID=3239953 RepID=UPI003D926937
MTPPLTGQRSRSELIAELYERHAAGLFAYCHDQLGETTSAADAVVAVFTTAPTAEPPSRAALYALARREIYRRDVSYALPAVDSVADPATALIERVFRDIRPHQREVLLLSEVCGLTAPELSLVLDVAADTAEELIAGAARRFGQTLETAVTAARSAPFVPDSVAEVYDAIAVSPIGDVLTRLPWRRPAASVRNRVLAALPYEEPGSTATGREQPSGLATKRLWPTTPTWPLPLSDPDQVTNTCVVKTDAIGQPQGSRRKAKHEATTEPMPRLRGSLLNSLAEGRLRRKRAGRPAPAERPEALAAPVEPQTSPRESTRPGTATPPAAGATESAPETFDAFGTSDVPRHPDPFDAFGTSGAPPRTEPFDAFGTSAPQAQPFDAFGNAPTPADPFPAPGTTGTPHRSEPFDAFGTTTPPPAEPFDAFGNPPRPADPFPAPGTTGTPHPADPLDALFDTLRFAVPFDAFGTAEKTGSPQPDESAGAFPQVGPFDPVPTAEQTGAFPQAFPQTGEPSGEVPPTPPLESFLPADPPVYEFAPAPPQADPAAGEHAEPFQTAWVADVPPSPRTDGERAAGNPAEKPDILVHPAAAAVPAPAPAGTRRAGRKRTAGKKAAGKNTTGKNTSGTNTASKHAGKPSGGDSAGKGRRVKRDRHYDWLWEVVGILICLIIAVIVFFNVPTVFTP